MVINGSGSAPRGCFLNLRGRSELEDLTLERREVLITEILTSYYVERTGLA